MSAVRFFPISWFEDSNWKSIQVVGRLENSLSVYIRVGFRPYFTVKYPETISIDTIDEGHTFLISETPVAEVREISPRVYRIYVKNKDDYNDSITYYEQNGLGEILDKDQEIKSKFFAEKGINPGSWQVATALKTLAHNITTGTNYATTDLEYYTTNITNAEDNLPVVNGVLVFFDIEAIPSDDVSFPDAEAKRPIDEIFAISLLAVNGNQIRRIVYYRTDQPLPAQYMTNPARTGQAYEVQLVRSNNEKELLIQFFDGLAQIKPDRLISMNGRRFDLNYIGAHVKLYGIQLPPFSKIAGFQPYFYPTTLTQVHPFPSRDHVWTLNAPGISQIDILDFYRRLYPLLGNHRLETLGQLILGRGKTGLSITEMISKFRRNTMSDIEEIIDYSIMDSILLYDLWTVSNIPQHLARMANEWKNDPEYVITHKLENLFDDLIHYIDPTVSYPRYNPGLRIVTERKPGIHRNVYLYSLSDVYLTFIEQLNTPLANTVADYFRPTNDGIIPFKSGYFPVTFNQVLAFIAAQVPADKIIWIEENSLAVQGDPPKSKDDRGPLPIFPLTDYIPLIIVSRKSWILVNNAGIVFKKGLSAFVRPPFPLIERYVNYLVRFLIENPNRPITFPKLEETLNDFVMETKISAEDFANPPVKKVEIIQQIRELGLPIPTTWRKIRYIKTVDGDIIEQIYSQAPNRYIKRLDLKYYNSTLQKALSSVLIPGR